MLGLILGLLPDAFKTIGGITSAISNERLKKIQATTDQEKIAADERIKHLEAIRDVRIASAGNPLTSIMMFGYGVGPLILLTKIYVYDKAFGQWTGGHTDPLGENLWWVITAQIAFYFIAKTIKG